MVVEAWLGSFRWTGIVTSCEVDAARVWPQGWACMLLAYPNLYSTTEIYIETPVEAYKHSIERVWYFLAMTWIPQSEVSLVRTRD
jgi:hypothetical protein